MLKDTNHCNHRVNMLYKYAIIIIMLISSNLSGQNSSIWIGENLTEITLNSGKWFYQSKGQNYLVKEVESKYYVIDEISGAPRYEIGFEKLSPEIDTIKLKKGLTIHLFIKPNLLNRNNFRFHSFEFAILGASGNVQTKYHLNKFGIFRKSNFKNETLIEQKVTNEQLNQFENLFQKIDIRNMKKAQGRRNNCDNLEYSFTFWDLNGKNYQYIAIDFRQQLLPIKEFIIDLEK